MSHSEVLDPSILDAYANSFYGYGNYNAKYWFIGMEEGGHDLRNKVECWNTRNRKELEDLVDFHKCIGVTAFFTERVKPQATWKMLIRLLLSAEGQDLSLANIKQYQQSLLARAVGNSCLLELLPLPSPSTTDFIHAGLLTQPHYANRETYRTHFVEQRATHIAERIYEYRPNAVIFYSTDSWYRTKWETIANVSFKNIGLTQLTG